MLISVKYQKSSTVIFVKDPFNGIGIKQVFDLGWIDRVFAWRREVATESPPPFTNLGSLLSSIMHSIVVWKINNFFEEMW